MFGVNAWLKRLNDVFDAVLTDGGLGGNNPRLRVDPAQTSFFDGREFRTFKELNIPSNSSYVIKAVVPIDVILAGLTVLIGAGHLRLATVVGGTEGGVFTQTLPVLSRNTMAGKPQPAYEPQVTLFEGGTLSGGTEIDVLRVKTNNISGQASSVGGSALDERGVGPGTYYYQLTNLSNTDPITGVFNARWEERP